MLAWFRISNRLALTALLLSVVFIVSAGAPACSAPCMSNAECDCALDEIRDSDFGESPSAPDEPDHRAMHHDECDCTCACHPPTTMPSGAALRGFVLPLHRLSHPSSRLAIHDGPVSKIHQPPKLPA